MSSITPAASSTPLVNAVHGAGSSSSSSSRQRAPADSEAAALLPTAAAASAVPLPAVSQAKQFSLNPFAASFTEPGSSCWGLMTQLLSPQQPLLPPLVVVGQQPPVLLQHQVLLLQVLLLAVAAKPTGSRECSGDGLAAPEASPAPAAAALL